MTKRRILSIVAVLAAILSMAQLNRVSVNQITGILTGAKGGTGNAYFTVAGPTAARTYTFENAATNVLSKQAAPTAYGVLLGTGGNAVGVTANCSTGTVLYGQTKADPICSTTTWPNAATQGDLLAATAANAVGSVAAVAAGQVLASAGTGAVPAYTATPTLSYVTVTAGTGTQTYRPSGLLDVSATQVGNGADTTEDTLYTYTVPANTLSATSRVIRVYAWGSFVNPGTDNKTVRLSFGGTNILSQAGGFSTGDFEIWGMVIYQSPGHQVAFGSFPVQQGASTRLASSLTATETDPNILKITGQNNTTATANTIIIKGVIVEILP